MKVKVILIAVISFTLLSSCDQASRLINKAAKKCAAAELEWDVYRSCRTSGYKDHRCESFRATAVKKDGECEAARAAVDAEALRQRAKKNSE